eukprot:COSAG06_NODE_65465_length_257_cov_0.544304_2_plen_40_part_01
MQPVQMLQSLDHCGALSYKLFFPLLDGRDHCYCCVRDILR